MLVNLIAVILNTCIRLLTNIGFPWHVEILRGSDLKHTDNNLTPASAMRHTFLVAKRRMTQMAKFDTRVPAATGKYNNIMT